MSNADPAAYEAILDLVKLQQSLLQQNGVEQSYLESPPGSFGPSSPNNTVDVPVNRIVLEVIDERAFTSSPTTTGSFSSPDNISESFIDSSTLAEFVMNFSGDMNSYMQQNLATDLVLNPQIFSENNSFDITSSAGSESIEASLENLRTIPILQQNDPLLVLSNPDLFLTDFSSSDLLKGMSYSDIFENSPLSPISLFGTSLTNITATQAFTDLPSPTTSSTPISREGSLPSISVSSKAHLKINTDFTNYIPSPPLSALTDDSLLSHELKFKFAAAPSQTNPPSPQYLHNQQALKYEEAATMTLTPAHDHLLTSQISWDSMMASISTGNAAFDSYGSASIVASSRDVIDNTHALQSQGLDSEMWKMMKIIGMS
jgi:hypothetical protein